MLPLWAVVACYKVKFTFLADELFPVHSAVLNFRGCLQSIQIKIMQWPSPHFRSWPFLLTVCSIFVGSFVESVNIIWSELVIISESLYFSLFSLKFPSYMIPGGNRSSSSNAAAFLGAFAQLGRATFSIVASVRPHGTTRLSLDGFSWHFVL